MSSEVIPFTGNDRLPVTRNDLSALEEKRSVLKTFVKSQLTEGIDNDFAVIPGTNKKSLLKPGAEKLMQLFGLGSTLTMTLKEIDHNGNFAMIAYKCEIFHIRSGVKICECEGATNSKEKKYATRTTWTKNANGSSVKTQEDTPIYDVLNTLMKMAQKRALVGAVIQATAASDFFTQDIDDEQDMVQNNLKPEIKDNAAKSKLGGTMSVTGNTFAHKDALKALGGKWNMNNKSYDFSNSNDELVAKIKAMEGTEIR